MTDVPKSFEDLLTMLAPQIHRSLERALRPLQDDVEDLKRKVARMERYLGEHLDSEFERVNARIAGLETAFNDGMQDIRQAVHDAVRDAVKANGRRGD